MLKVIGGTTKIKRGNSYRKMSDKTPLNTSYETMETSDQITEGGDDSIIYENDSRLNYMMEQLEIQDEEDNDYISSSSESISVRSGSLRKRFSSDDLLRGLNIVKTAAAAEAESSLRLSKTTSSRQQYRLSTDDPSFEDAKEEEISSSILYDGDVEDDDDDDDDETSKRSLSLLCTIQMAAPAGEDNNTAAMNYSTTDSSAKQETTAAVAGGTSPTRVFVPVVASAAAGEPNTDREYDTADIPSSLLPTTSGDDTTSGYTLPSSLLPTSDEKSNISLGAIVDRQVKNRQLSLKKQLQAKEEQEQERKYADSDDDDVYTTASSVPPPPPSTTPSTTKARGGGGAGSSLGPAAYCKHYMLNDIRDTQWEEERPFDEVSLRRSACSGEDGEETSTIYSGEGNNTDSGTVGIAYQVTSEDTHLPPLIRPSDAKFMNTVKNVVTMQQQQQQHQPEVLSRTISKDDTAVINNKKNNRSRHIVTDIESDESGEIVVRDPTMLSKIEESYETPNKKRRRNIFLLLGFLLFIITLTIVIILTKKNNKSDDNNNDNTKDESFLNRGDGGNNNEDLSITPVVEEGSTATITTPGDDGSLTPTRSPTVQIAGANPITLVTIPPSSTTAVTSQSDQPIDSNLTVEEEEEEEEETGRPTRNPTFNPTLFPTRSPTGDPTNSPTTNSPSEKPTTNPTRSPTRRPTRNPTSAPIIVYTSEPTNVQVINTRAPIPMPTSNPVSFVWNPLPGPAYLIGNDNDNNEEEQEEENISNNSDEVTAVLCLGGSNVFSASNYCNCGSDCISNPTVCDCPLGRECCGDANNEEEEQTPVFTVTSDFPTTKSPTLSGSPSSSPTKQPTRSPTASPSKAPSLFPSVTPTERPTTAPSLSPTTVPTRTMSPTTVPSHTPTAFPSVTPTNSPTCIDEISVDKGCYDRIISDLITVDLKMCNPERYDWVGIYEDGTDPNTLDDNYGSWIYTCGDRDCKGPPSTPESTVLFHAQNLTIASDATSTYYRAYLIQDYTKPYQASAISNSFRISPLCY